MKFALLAAVLAGLAIFAASARGSEDASSPATARPAGATLSWAGWADSLRASAPAGAAQRPVQALAPTGPDVVDAHWMALTMWGEARGSGEEGMRAVGHVIANRRELGRHGSFVTDTVSEAWQFSCWNPGDPNRAAIDGIGDLSRDSRDYRMWLTARRLAEEILAGRSEDPTGGSLYYHALEVAPRWADGVPPVRRIGGHLFYLAAR